MRAEAPARLHRIRGSPRASKSRATGDGREGRQVPAGDRGRQLLWLSVEDAIKRLSYGRDKTSSSSRPALEKSPSHSVR